MGLWPFIRFLEVSNNHTRSKASLLVASRLTDKYWWLWNAFAFDHLGHDESNPRPLSAIRPRCMVKSCYFQKHIFTFVWWSSWILFTTDCIFNIQCLIHHTGGDESYIRIWQVACDPWSILPVVGTGDSFWTEYLQKYHQRWRLHRNLKTACTVHTVYAAYTVYTACSAKTLREGFQNMEIWNGICCCSIFYFGTPP